tara:strand:- start:40981 stop:41226 length:246 start_codon:yes stop_codon:yes gene_type:complete
MKNNMKKMLKVIGKVFIWIFYLMITGKERQKYQHAKHRKREVLDVKNDAFGSTYSMGRYLGDKEPKRNYLTWKEYRKIHEF